jgi:hypothetical protein
MRRTFMASCVAAFAITVRGVQAQTPASTPIKSFGEVAGKWEGVSSPSGVKVSLEVSDMGAFSVSSRLGEDKGTATIEDGLLLVRYTSNQGYLKLTMISGALEGPAVYQTRTGSIKLTRAR